MVRENWVLLEFEFYSVVLYLRQLDAGFSPPRPGFSTGWMQVGLVGKKSRWSRIFSEFFAFPLTVIMIPHSSVTAPWGVRSPDQAAHYHTLGRKLRALSLTLHVAGLGVKVLLNVFHAVHCSYVDGFSIVLRVPTYTTFGSFLYACPQLNGCHTKYEHRMRSCVVLSCNSHFPRCFLKLRKTLKITVALSYIFL